MSEPTIVYGPYGSFSIRCLFRKHDWRKKYSNIKRHYEFHYCERCGQEAIISGSNYGFGDKTVLFVSSNPKVPPDECLWYRPFATLGYPCKVYLWMQWDNSKHNSCKIAENE